jgi:hypothetical protein
LMECYSVGKLCWGLLGAPGGPPVPMKGSACLTDNISNISSPKVAYKAAAIDRTGMRSACTNECVEIATLETRTYGQPGAKGYGGVVRPKGTGSE